MNFPVALVPWVQRSLAAGATPAKLVSVLTLDWGYSPQVADRVVQSAAQGSAFLALPDLGARPDVQRTAQGAAVRKLQTLPDWHTEVVVELAAPQIVVFRNFVPERLAQQVLDERASFAANFDKSVIGERAVNDHLLKREGAGLACLQAASNALNWPLPRWGAPLVRDTAQGTDFALHFDAFNPESPDDARFLKCFDGNHRIGTLLIYLEPAAEGGSTYFANLGLRVNLNAGDALYFGYSTKDLARSGLLHGGEMVRAGLKRIMTLFCYERDLVATAQSAPAQTSY